jgi:hypothetical protein
VSIVWVDSDITAAALIEVIHGLTTYWVRYGKAWRAKEHTLALLWGDWREAYAKVPRLLHAIAHFNPGTKCVIDTCGQWLPNETGRYYPVLKHVFWCFPQCWFLLNLSIGIIQEGVTGRRSRAMRNFLIKFEEKEISLRRG